MNRRKPESIVRQYCKGGNCDPMLLRSEWGSFTYDGRTDMRVLRSRAEEAIKYFNNGRPIVSMESNLFGYPFSIISNGKLVDVDMSYKGNVITRCLSYHDRGYYAGKTTLRYDDDYADGRGFGGSGAVLMGDVRDVRIEDGYLVISGMDLNKEVTYEYEIQDHPDEKRRTFPIPKGGKIPVRQPSLDDYERPIRRVKPRDDVKPIRPSKPRKSVERTEMTAEEKKVPKPKPTSSKHEKPVEQPKERTTGQNPKNASKPKEKYKKEGGNLVYEVRVGGKVEGSFSSKSKAEMLKRELKKQGKQARIVGVFCS